MNDIISNINPEMSIWIIFGLLFILFILIFIQWSIITRMRKKYLKMLNGDNPETVEELLINLQNKLNSVVSDNEKQNQVLVTIEAAMKKMKSKVGIYRYNAFSEHGSDLSFSVAIMDEHQDGVVLTGLHNRDDTYIYAKPISSGQSQYTLSPEEKEAINRSS